MIAFIELTHTFKKRMRHKLFANILQVEWQIHRRGGDPPRCLEHYAFVLIQFGDLSIGSDLDKQCIFFLTTDQCLAFSWSAFLLTCTHTIYR
jgi:hypothetical protein